MERVARVIGVKNFSKYSQLVYACRDLPEGLSRKILKEIEQPLVDLIKQLGYTRKDAENDMRSLVLGDDDDWQDRKFLERHLDDFKDQTKTFGRGN